MPLQGGLLLAALPNLYLNESPVNYVTDGNALSTYLISQESQKMDQTLMAIQTKFTIATFIGDEKMFREAVDAYKKWILILKLRSSKKHSLPPFPVFLISPAFRGRYFHSYFRSSAMNAYYIQDRLEAQSWARHYQQIAREEKEAELADDMEKGLPQHLFESLCIDHLQRHGASKKAITRAFDDDVEFQERMAEHIRYMVETIAHHQVDIDSEV